jgi:hypothetical protein
LLLLAVEGKKRPEGWGKEREKPKTKIDRRGKASLALIEKKMGSRVTSRRC